MQARIITLLFLLILCAAPARASIISANCAEAIAPNDAVTITSGGVFLASHGYAGIAGIALQSGNIGTGPIQIQTPDAVTQSGTWSNQLLDSSGVNKATIDSSGALKTTASLNINGSTPSSSNPLYTTHAGQTSAANETNVSASVPNTDTTITFTASACTVVIKTTAASAILYFNFAGTATSSNFQIDPGGSYTYVGAPRSSIHILGASATGTYSIHAY